MNLQVSIHAPAKGATGFWPCRGTRPSSFNPRPREGGDYRSVSKWNAVSCFNPRPREGGDHSYGGSSSAQFVFQSTPPRRGRPRAAGVTMREYVVSIHAPAKGATSTLYPIVKQQNIPLSARTIVVWCVDDSGSVEFTRKQHE